MNAENKNNKDIKLQECNDGCVHYREVADKIWELSREYEGKGLLELASELKNISSNIHDLARLKESLNAKKVI
jgi:hypothetical protein